MTDTTSESLQRLRDLFGRAISEPPEDRPEWIERECGSDRRLRAHLERLLEVDSRAQEKLELRKLAPGELSEVVTQDRSSLPERIGSYRIVDVIASGGMGVVYRAQQEQPRRIVAVKVMRQGLTSNSARQRFQYESQVLARLRHPGIAQIYEAGVHRDQGGELPYFASVPWLT